MLAPEGYSTIIVVLLFAVAVAWASSFLDHWSAYLIYGLLLLLLLLFLNFFRDPERHTPRGEQLVVAPADGRVVLIKEVENDYITGKRGTQISIFLSPVDVHVNRVPVTGKLEYVKYFPGKFLMAWEDDASRLNEQAHFGLLHPGGKRFLFKQITGFLARRIVYHIGEGDEVKTGERFGIMKFGSRMDLLIPAGVEIHAKKGDRTVAGETIVAVIPSVPDP